MIPSMKARDWYTREKYVVIHGQTAKFRLVKYAIILAVAAGIYLWQGWAVLGIAFGCAFILSIGIHLLFRWKTKAWTQDWGPYKKLTLPV